ncbi:MAG: SDR family oxidoreductase [Gemmatimonadetes bacterium]|nr:SDR family oxidoreductase [Gemmatimonadota bacterium]MDA1102608.1 SDR family oxidoreductase [Gemmatimonadota bacterium]
MPNLTGKVAIVTGSTKGIGLAIAERMINQGASVVVSSRTESEIAAVTDRLGSNAFGVVCDVADPVACQRLVDETMARFGRLDVLVNNAGLGIFKPISEMTVEEWRLQVDVNLGGVFYCSKAALPHLSASGDGFIINIGSLASRNTFAAGTGYNASKFGLLGMSEAMMLDVRYDDVRVSIVMPGSVNTPFNNHEPSEERTWKLEADDCALAVMQILDYPPEAHVSRIEMRPAQPNKDGVRR